MNHSAYKEKKTQKLFPLSVSRYSSSGLPSHSLSVAAPHLGVPYSTVHVGAPFSVSPRSLSALTGIICGLICHFADISCSILSSRAPFCGVWHALGTVYVRHTVSHSMLPRSCQTVVSWSHALVSAWGSGMPSVWALSGSHLTMSVHRV